MRKVVFQITYHLTKQYDKDSDEVKHVLNEHIVQRINYELHKERNTQS